MIKDLTFPHGLQLLSRYQAGGDAAKARLRQIFDAALAGQHDADFATPAPADRVHVSGSVHMLALGILHDLYGIESASYYKTDPWRYARANLITSRLLGIEKYYSTWALYAFTCEALGQKMMYPDRFPPGSDPDEPLINSKNWRALTTPDFNSGVPRIINDFTRVTEHLTGAAPLLQISAPYSLAADIYGQEPLLADVVHNPDQVNALLDHLADQVLVPWIEHFLAEFPNGWIELSDASGSPFFIGPQNCKTMAIRAMQRMTAGKPWAERLFDCNYRGDFVTQAKKKNRRARRGTVEAVPEIDLHELTELKHSVCPKFIMRLEADQVPVEFYRDQAIARGVPLTLGIGSGEVDGNSVGDIALAKIAIRGTAQTYVEAIKAVCKSVPLPADNNVMQPWPSHIYFEDISAQSQFEMIEVIVRTALENGTI
ncbi:hypothetical protein MNBD_ALPHA07-1342 [hydrothermal vent metagenome]|uniref:Uroporphyrinogen decarboxylase (URO-D) domain-containing protein n=1 Tax=hydrothermal vent metagenome TaxID=652676 RepID=A0A3B0S7R5_9ZZZZ